MKQVIAPVLLGGGIFLIVLSLAWPTFFSAKSALSEDEYAKLDALEQRVEKLYLEMQSYQRRTQSAGPPKETVLKMEETVAERDALRSKLEAGIDRPSSVSTVMRYSGAALVLAGFCAHLLNRPD